MLTVIIVLVLTGAGWMFYHQQPPKPPAPPAPPDTQPNVYDAYRQHVGDVAAIIATTLDRELPGLEQGARAHLIKGYERIGAYMNMPPTQIAVRDPHTYYPRCITGLTDFIRDTARVLKPQLPEFYCKPHASGFPTIDTSVAIETTEPLEHLFTAFAARYFQPVPQGWHDFLASIPCRINVDERLWFEHCAMFAATGSGKTNTLSYCINHRLNQVAQGRASVVVMESNRDLVMSIARLKRFAPGGDLHGKLILVDFEDVEHTIGINPFNVPPTTNLTPATREALYTATIWSLEYLYKSLFAMELTPRQATLLQFATNLMLVTPGANLDAMHALMQPNGIDLFRSWLPRTDADTQAFFADHFDDPRDTFISQTKQQIVARLFALKRIGGLARMMNAAETTLDLASELSANKVILINVSAQHLAETGVEVIGRYFLSLMVRAMRHRALIRPQDRLPTYVFLDECHSFIASDASIETLLDEARKYLISITLATQRPDKLQDPVLRAIYGSTAIRFAAKLSDSSASQVARNMGDTTPEFIKKAPDHTFACYIRGIMHTSIYYRPPEFDFSRMPASSSIDGIRTAMRAKYTARPAPEWKRKPEPPRAPVTRPEPPPKPARKPVKRKAKLSTDRSEYT